MPYSYLAPSISALSRRLNAAEAYGLSSSVTGRHHTLAATLPSPLPLSSPSASLTLFFTAQAPLRTPRDATSFALRLYAAGTDPRTITRDTRYIASFGFELDTAAQPAPLRHVALSLWPRDGNGDGDVDASSEGDSAATAIPVTLRDRRGARPRVQAGLDQRTHSYLFHLDLNAPSAGGDGDHVLEFDGIRYGQQALRPLLAPHARARTSPSSSPVPGAGGAAASEADVAEDAADAALSEWRARWAAADKAAHASGTMRFDDAAVVALHLFDADRAGTVIDNVYVAAADSKEAGAAQLQDAVTFRAAVFGGAEVAHGRDQWVSSLKMADLERKRVQEHMEEIRKQTEKEYKALHDRRNVAKAEVMTEAGADKAEL